MFKLSFSPMGESESIFKASGSCSCNCSCSCPCSGSDTDADGSNTSARYSYFGTWEYSG